MVEWHHQLNGQEFEQTLGDGEGQGSPMCCSPWGHRVRHNLANEQQLTLRPPDLHRQFLSPEKPLCEVSGGATGSNILRPQADFLEEGEGRGEL